jgi:hypothetical protein
MYKIEIVDIDVAEVDSTIFDKKPRSTTDATVDGETERTFPNRLYYRRAGVEDAVVVLVAS